MTPEQFVNDLRRKEQEIQRACERTIPLKVSVAMEEHVKDNFRAGGFMNNGLQPWKSTIRQSEASGEDALRTPLLSRNRNLMNATKHRYTPYKATVYNDAPYASIHNEGGTIPVTASMKRFFWAKYYQTKLLLFKHLAFMPVGSLITIPKRTFMGDSFELQQQVREIIDNELIKIINL